MDETSFYQPPLTTPQTLGPPSGAGPSAKLGDVVGAVGNTVGVVGSTVGSALSSGVDISLDHTVSIAVAVTN